MQWPSLLLLGKIQFFSNMAEPDIMTWFPRREDYEDKPQILPDETYEEKIQRLLDTIDAAQQSIKEVVDGDTLDLEQKIYRTMDTAQDMDDIAKLQKDIEGHPEAGNNQDTLKKARVGLINLKASESKDKIVLMKK